MIVSKPSPLSLDGWLEYNKIKWGLKPLRISLKRHDTALPSIETVLYLNGRNKFRTPALNPYAPVEVHFTDTHNLHRLNRQWLELSEILLDEMKRYRIDNYISLPPQVADVRPWLWKKYIAEVFYTFVLDFPFNRELVHSSVKKNINKADRLGLKYVKLEDRFETIFSCIEETEKRQRFSYELKAKDLYLMQELLGKEHFRCYTAWSDDNKVAAVRIVLHRTGGEAIDMVAATSTAFLHSGVTQGLINYIFEDLCTQGAASFDFAGAGIPSVAAAKADWGAQLMPYYMVSEFNSKWILKKLYLRARR